MSEEATGSVVAEAPVVEATPADQTAVTVETPAEDIDTDAFDRMEVPDDGDEPATDGAGEDASEAQKRRDAGEDGLVEVEIDGKTHRVPPDLKDAFMRTIDYSKKTGELADARREIDTQRQELAAKADQQAESMRAFRTEHANIAAREAEVATVDPQLAEYSKLSLQDWAALRSQDPAAYQAHTEQHDFLKRAKEASKGALEAAQADLAKKEDDLTKAAAETRQGKLREAWGETNAVLTKKIEGWSPAKGQELGQMLVDQFGVTPEELKEATDARVWIMADELTRLRAENARLKTAGKQTAATEAALKTQIVEPAKKPAGTGSAGTGVHDNLSDAEWLRRRNAQIARRGKG